VNTFTPAEKPACGLNITFKKKAKTLKAGLERVSDRLDATKPAGVSPQITNNRRAKSKERKLICIEQAFIIVTSASSRDRDYFGSTCFYGYQCWSYQP